MPVYKSANEYITSQFMKKTSYEKFDVIFNLEEPKDFLNFIDINYLNRIMINFNNTFNNNVLIDDIDNTNKDEIIKKIIEIVKTTKYYLVFNVDAPKTASEAYNINNITGYEFTIEIIVYLIGEHKNTIDIQKSNKLLSFTFLGKYSLFASNNFVDINRESFDIDIKNNCEDLQFIEICNFILDNYEILDKLEEYPMNDEPDNGDNYDYYEIIENTINNEKNKMIKKLKNSGISHSLLDDEYYTNEYYTDELSINSNEYYTDDLSIDSNESD